MPNNIAAPRVIMRNPSLDILRGVAALMIFMLHYFALYRVPSTTNEQIGQQVILTYFGNGVPLFYALSAFSLFLGYINRKSLTKEFFFTFYVARIFRIAPLFYLIATIWYVIFYSRGAILSKEMVITTLTFTSNLFPGYEETFVAAGWSIGVEMLFYAIFPIILLNIISLKRAVVFWILSIFISIIGRSILEKYHPNSQYPHFSLISNFMYFSTGVLAYFVGTKCLQLKAMPKYKGWILSIATTLTLLLVYLLASGQLMLLNRSMLRIYICVIIFLLILCAYFHPTKSKLSNRLSKLGEQSFSIYLLHPILLFFSFEYLHGYIYAVLGEGTLCFWVLFLICAFFLILCSKITYFVIEQNGIKLGRKIVKSIQNANYKR